ncbi:uncharacterized protein LOC104869818 [Fukomys damarensis]|uniref:uncharacterized protein LOC104869818 n=1 Tax=Fukomys damarensis TaxID=885580 RepID=UPI001454E617|nr:uncharacterized protein LOC104869818 [Fukomys damarensis]
MLCCFPRPQGRRPRTPRKESTWQRVRRWFTCPRCFRTFTRSCPTVTDCTGQVSPDPFTRCPEMRGSPGKVSLGQNFICSETPSPVQIYIDLATSSADSLADLGTVSTVQAGPSHTVMESVEQDFPERKSRSASSIPDSSPELISQVDPQDDLLLNQLEPPEPTEAELHDPAHTDVPPAELVPAPPAAPVASLAPQQEPAPGSPAPPGTQLQLLAPWQVSSLQIYLDPALHLQLPFACLTHLLNIVFIIGNQSIQSLAEIRTVRVVQAGELHNLTEPLEQAFLESWPFHHSFQTPQRPTSPPYRP